MKNFKIKTLLIIICALFISGCVSNKNYILLQNKKTFEVDSTSEIIKVTYSEHRLQKGDILYFSLTTDDARINTLFANQGNTTTMMQQGGTQVGAGMFYYTGYYLNDSGNIDLPYFGKVYLLNKTVEEAKNSIDAKVGALMKNYVLNVRLAELRFSVLGEVNKPGRYAAMFNRLNLLDALMIAGDFKSLAKRYKVNLLRKYGDGYKIHILDFTNKDLISSPYFQIQQDDMLYVEPIKSRVIGDFTNFQGSLTLITSFTSLFLVMFNTYLILGR